jgi:glutathione S-transferase
MAKLVLYGFSGSTYVRTVRMVLHEKRADYEQVPVNVLAGEPRQAEHLTRHPFGKVPVLDHDGFRILETSAIAPYLDEVLPGPALTPATPRDRARMRMTMGIVDSYGYGALLGLAGYHLFPEFIGGADEAKRQHALATSRLVLGELMKIRGADPFIAGAAPSLADFYLAPPCFYVGLTPDAAAAFDVPGFAEWWARAQALESFKATTPNLG